METIGCAGMAVVCLALAFLILTGIRRARKSYKKSSYHKETKKRKKKVEQDPGATGEYETSRALERIKGRKRFIFNAYIPKGSRSGCTETDIIVIHEKGILVIENKNYGGMVWGDAKNSQWYHMVGGRRFLFYNPIYQNKGHIRTLRKYLEEKLGRESFGIPYESVIVFNDRTRIGRIRHVKKQALVCSSRKAARKLNRRLRRMPVVLDEEQMERIYQILKAETKVFFWVKASHKRNIRKNW